MIDHTINHRDQLAKLHDRHKHFSMMVYDHTSAKEKEKREQAHAQMEEAEKELADFKKKCFTR
jgi:hypothetical protein